MAYTSESTDAGRTDPSASGAIKPNGHAVPDGTPSEQSTPLPCKFAHLHEESTPTPSRTASPRRSNSALGTRPHDGHVRVGRAPSTRAKSRGKLSWLFSNNRDTGEPGRFHIGLFAVSDLVKGCTAADLHMEGNSTADYYFPRSGSVRAWTEACVQRFFEDWIRFAFLPLPAAALAQGSQAIDTPSSALCSLCSS